ncbi:Uma2 family endonuclease [Desulfobacter vibrioformis]|uniref:Uma2 family endonuclease n=1 Tax=Desulfobacter vibrioformis TaxID=34031 RepID=UPI00055728F4|nr:Uma2 family endonuclease [Desulfobacter vibrioformis]
MNIQPQEKTIMTPGEYLILERASLDIKHEFYDGEIFAMVGASRHHNRINMNLARELGIKFKADNFRCEAFSNDMRVKIENSYVYPDIVITCGDAEFEDNEFDTLTNPVVIMEILSDSTELFDRTKKFFYYRKITTLQEYLLVSQHEYWVEKYTRQNDIWRYQSFEGADQILKIESSDCKLPLSEIYLNVEFEQRMS